MITQLESLQLSLRLEQLANLEANELAEVMGAAATELLRLHEVNQELLVALKVLVDNGGIGPEDMFDDARAAIAKATGGVA